MKIDISFRRKAGIYEIRNLVTNDFYIGSSKSLYNRCYDHFNALKNKKHHNTHLQRSWNKYGRENFKFNVLLLCHNLELITNEQKFIDDLKPQFNKNLNVTQPYCRVLTDLEKESVSKVVKQSYLLGTRRKTYKVVLVYDLNGNFIREFESLISCAEGLSINSYYISKCLSGKTGKCKNYQLRYKDDIRPIGVYKKKYVERSITDMQFLEVFELKQKGLKHIDIAKILNIHVNCISKVINNKYK